MLNSFKIFIFIYFLSTFCFAFQRGVGEDECGLLRCKQENFRELSTFLTTKPIEVSVGKPATDDAKTLRAKLEVENFNCTHNEVADPSKSITCIGRVNGYSQPVRIYIPFNYTKKTKPKINLFFHGHRLKEFDTFETGGYDTRLAESGSADLLVIPESIGKGATYDRELWGPAGIKNLITQIENKTDSKGATYKLSAHSGGGRIVNQVLQSKVLDERVENLALFDAIYQDMPAVREYLKVSSKNTLQLTYIDKGSTVDNTNSFLRSFVAQPDQIQKNPIPAANPNAPTTEDHMMIIKNGGFSQFLAK